MRVHAKPTLKSLMQPSYPGTGKLKVERCLEITPPMYIRRRITFGVGQSVIEAGSSSSTYINLFQQEKKLITFIKQENADFE